MMLEEFEQLTGVIVSLGYYEEKIEPLYVLDNEDKQSFCAEWKKLRKL